MSVSDMPDDDILGAIEALLFVSDEPVSAMTLADMLGRDVAFTHDALARVQERLASRQSGIQLREVAGGWRLYTHPRYHDLIERYVVSWDTRRLSQAALETLAVIAYNQPITRAGVAGVRGVNSDSPINSLVEKGLVREAGREASPGQPILYATTRAFLEKFGLASCADLPDVAEYAPDEESRALIRERLGVARDASAASEVLLDDGDDDLTLDLGLDEGLRIGAFGPSAHGPSAADAPPAGADARPAGAHEPAAPAGETSDAETFVVAHGGPR